MRTSYRDRLEKYRAYSDAVYARAQASMEEAEYRRRPRRATATFGESLKAKTARRRQRRRKIDDIGYDHDERFAK